MYTSLHYGKNNDKICPVGNKAPKVCLHGGCQLFLPLSCQSGCRNTVCCRWSACCPGRSHGNGSPLQRSSRTGRSRPDGGRSPAPGTGRPPPAEADTRPPSRRSSRGTSWSEHQEDKVKRNLTQRREKADSHREKECCHSTRRITAFWGQSYS